MNLSKYALLALLFNPVAAMAGSASESSIRELFDVMHMRQSFEDKQTLFRIRADNFLQRSLKSKNHSPREQKTLSNFSNKIATLFLESLSWEKQEPIILRIYQDAFTEEEVAGMLDFYKTPAGQAVIVKMPQLEQRVSQEVQKTTQEMAQQIRNIELEFVAEMAVAKEEEATAKSEGTATKE